MTKHTGWLRWVPLPLGVLCCALPYLLIPRWLGSVSEALLRPGLSMLLYLLPLLLAVFVPNALARRGVPALLVCLLPTAGYLLVLLSGMEPFLWVLMLGLALSVLSASFGQERRRLAQRKQK